MKSQKPILQFVNGYNIEYWNTDSFDDLPLGKCTQSYGVCYFQDMVVICKNFAGGFTLPGGTIEPGEGAIEALIREVKEESNMRVLSQSPLGYQKVWKDSEDAFFQLRFYSEVEPYGSFIEDPAGQIVEVMLVSEVEAVKLLNWGEVGQMLLARAAKLHAERK